MANLSGYDLSVTTFSPDGRVFQVEYAQKVLENHLPSICYKCKDGIVLATEKNTGNKLLRLEKNYKIFPIDKNISIVISGMIPDGKHLVQRAQQEAWNYSS